MRGTVMSKVQPALLVEGNVLVTKDPREKGRRIRLVSFVKSTSRAKPSFWHVTSIDARGVPVGRPTRIAETTLQKSWKITSPGDAET